MSGLGWELQFGLFVGDGELFLDDDLHAGCSGWWCGWDGGARNCDGDDVDVFDVDVVA